MTIEDVIPLVESLPRHDKLKLIQLISGQLVQDEQVILATAMIEPQYRLGIHSKYFSIVLSSGGSKRLLTYLAHPPNKKL